MNDKKRFEKEITFDSKTGNYKVSVDTNSKADSKIEIEPLTAPNSKPKKTTATIELNPLTESKPAPNKNTANIEIEPLTPKNKIKPNFKDESNNSIKATGKKSSKTVKNPNVENTMNITREKEVLKKLDFSAEQAVDVEPLTDVTGRSKENKSELKEMELLKIVKEDVKPKTVETELSKPKTTSVKGTSNSMYNFVPLEQLGIDLELFKFYLGSTTMKKNIPLLVPDSHRIVAIPTLANTSISGMSPNGGSTAYLIVSKGDNHSLIIFDYAKATYSNVTATIDNGIVFAGSRPICNMKLRYFL